MKDAGNPDWKPPMMNYGWMRHAYRKDGEAAEPRETDEESREEPRTEHLIYEWMREAYGHKDS